MYTNCNDIHEEFGRCAGGRIKPADILELAERNVIVNAWVARWRRGDVVSWEEAMMGAVLMLADGNKRLVEHALEAWRRPPFMVE